MIEEFDSTAKIFAQDLQEFQAFVTREIKEANNQLASQTWARKTWIQRINDSQTTHVVLSHSSEPTKYLVTPIHAFVREPIVCETLCQMQFGKDLTFGCDDNC